MNQKQETVVVRERGQITIPFRIRKNHKWLSIGSVVTIISDGPDRIIIRPYKNYK